MRVSARPASWKSSDPVSAMRGSIEVRATTTAASLAVVRDLRTREVGAALAGGIRRRAGGNPLVLEELCHSLPDDREVREGLEAAQAPRTVPGLIQARVARLEHAEADVSRAA